MESLSFQDYQNLHDQLNEVTARINNLNATDINKIDSLYFIRGTLHGRMRDFADAELDFNAAIKINANEWDYYFNRATNYINQGRFELSISDLHRAIQLNPSNYVSYFQLGSACREIKDYIGSVDALNTYIAYFPDDAEAYFLRGHSKLDLKDYEGAIKDCDEAIACKSDDAQFFVCRGVSRYCLGDKDGALKDYDQAFMMDKMVDFDWAIDFNPEDTDALVVRGGIHIHSGNLSRAMADFNLVLNINPYYVTAHVGLAFVFNAQGKKTEAISCMLKAKSLGFQEADEMIDIFCN